MTAVLRLYQTCSNFFFIKSTKPNFHYLACKTCLLHLPFIFQWCCFACGTNQVNMLIA